MFSTQGVHVFFDTNILVSTKVTIHVSFFIYSLIDLCVHLQYLCSSIIQFKRLGMFLLWMANQSSCLPTLRQTHLAGLPRKNVIFSFRVFLCLSRQASQTLPAAPAIAEVWPAYRCLVLGLALGFRDASWLLVIVGQ